MSFDIKYVTLNSLNNSYDFWTYFFSEHPYFENVDEMICIGDRKDYVCLRMHGQKFVSPNTAISMLDSKGQAFVLIQVLYTLGNQSLEFL